MNCRIAIVAFIDENIIAWLSSTGLFKQSMHKRHEVKTAPHGWYSVPSDFDQITRCSAQYGRSDNPEGRLTEYRIIEVLL